MSICFKCKTFDDFTKFHNLSIRELSEGTKELKVDIEFKEYLSRLKR